MKLNNLKVQDYQQQSTDLETSSMLGSNNAPERVKVSVRLRPFIDEELNSKDRSICVEHIDMERGLIVVKKDFEKRQFQFDYLFDPKSSQVQVYQRVAKPIVESVVKGVNGTIFCYGQTGTGKTYTMMGNPDSEERGITPRALEQVFCDIAKETKNCYQVQIAYMQIYMEMLLDLINPENNEVKIRECPDSGVFVSGLEWVGVDGPLECLRVLSYAEKNRIVAFTNLNAHSSRSHSILMVRVERRVKSLVSSQNSNISNSRKLQTSQSVKRQVRSSGGLLSQDLSCHNHEDIDESGRMQQSSQVVSSATLYLVDLAGSERVKKSRATGDRLNEARAINYSLTALGKCIHALTDPKTTFVPFRDSKLTRILQDALGGNCKTALVVNIGPSMKHAEETISSLSFGMRAMKVQNMPMVNVVKDQQDMDAKSGLIDRLQSSQHRLVQQVQQLEREVLNLKEGQSGGGGSDVGMEMQYRNQITRMEEEHKAFLEEIDHMMIDQEAENDILKKQLHEVSESNQLQQQEIQQAISNKNELLSVIQELHQIIDLKDNELNESQLSLVAIERENHIIQEEQRTFQDQQTTLLQDNTQRAFAAQDALRTSKERQINEFRYETEQLSSKYAKLLEDKRRLECDLEAQSKTKQQNQHDVTLRATTISDLQINLNERQVEIMTKDSEMSAMREGERKLRRQIEELKQRINDTNVQHDHELQSLNQTFARERSVFEKEATLMAKQKHENYQQLKLDSEDATNKLNQMHTEYINLSQDRDSQISTLNDLNRRLEVQDSKLNKSKLEYQALIDQVMVDKHITQSREVQLKYEQEQELETTSARFLDEKKQYLCYFMESLERDYQNHIDELQVQLAKIHTQFFEIKKISDANVECLKDKDAINGELKVCINVHETQLLHQQNQHQRQLSHQTENNQELEKQTIQQQEQLFEYDQQIQMMMQSHQHKVNEQVGVITALQAELLVAHRSQYQQQCQTEEQIFQAIEMKRSIALSGLHTHESGIILELQTRINQLEDQLRVHHTKDAVLQGEFAQLIASNSRLSLQLDERVQFIEHVCGELKFLQDEQFSHAQDKLDLQATNNKLTQLTKVQDTQLLEQVQLINSQQDKLFQQYQVIEHLNGDLQFLNNKVNQQSLQLSVLSMKSQRAVLKIEDVLVSEVVRGVMENIVMQVELNEALDESMHHSQLYATCQTPVNRPAQGLFTATARQYSIKSHISSVEQKSLAKFQIDFDTNDSLLLHNDLQKTFHQQLVESLFIEEDEEEQDEDAADILLPSLQLCSKANPAIMEQSDEESMDSSQTPALKTSFASVRQYQSEPNEQRSAFQMPSFFERSSFKNNGGSESDLLNQIVSLAQSRQHFNLTQTKQSKQNESLYSFSDKQSGLNPNSFRLEDEEVKQVLFSSASKSEFMSNPPSEIASLKGSLVVQDSTLNFESGLVEKFMSKVKQRQFNLMENFDLSIGSIQQAMSASKQQSHLKSEIAKALSDQVSFSLRSRSSLKDVSNDENVQRRDVNTAYLDDKAYDKNTLIEILAKLLDCAEQTHSEFVDSLMKKAKHLIVVEEQEELIRMMAMIMVDKQKSLRQQKSETSVDDSNVKPGDECQITTYQKVFSPKMVKSESCLQVTQQQEREAGLLVQRSLQEFKKMARCLNNQFVL